MGTIIALGKRIMVKEIVVKNLTSYGFDVSGVNSAEKFKTGEVVSVGNDCPRKAFKIFGFYLYNKPLLKKGDIIAFDKFRATKFTYKEQTNTIVPYDDLICKL